jgi:hypothetical protein
LEARSGRAVVRQVWVDLGRLTGGGVGSAGRARLGVVVGWGAGVVRVCVCLVRFEGRGEGLEWRGRFTFG